MIKLQFVKNVIQVVLNVLDQQAVIVFLVFKIQIEWIIQLLKEELVLAKKVIFLMVAIFVNNVIIPVKLVIMLVQMLAQLVIFL